MTLIHNILLQLCCDSILKWQLDVQIGIIKLNLIELNHPQIFIMITL